MTFARRLHFAAQSQGPTLLAGWAWNGSMLDNAGGCMAAHFDGTNWFTGSDIGGVHKLVGSIGGAGIMRQFDAGRYNTAGNTFDNDYHKVTAIRSNGTVAYSVGGDGSKGAIHKRNLSSDTKWILQSSNYYGDAGRNPIGNGRPVGNRRIHIDDATNCVYVACQSLSDGNRGGIAVSKNGGSFTNFHNASTFTVGRMFRALQGSQNWSDILYATADNDTGIGATGSGNVPGVFVYTNASDTPSIQRIDNLGGGPSNIDWKDMCVVKEGTKDVLYIASGYRDGANGGIWRCTINTDPNSWGIVNVIWDQLLVAGTSSAAVDYISIYAYRAAGATYALAGTNPAQKGGIAVEPVNLSGTIPGTGGVNYVKEVVRSLDAHTASPTWDAVTDAINISPGATYLPVYNTSGANAEIWLQEAGSMNSATNGYSFRKTILGGPAHEVFDLDVDPVSGIAVISGKQGSWIGFNIWSTTLSDIQWQPFSQQSGNCTNHGVEVHPTKPLAVAHSDTDRMVYFNLEGGDGQSQGAFANYSSPLPAGHSSFICQGGANSGRLLIGSEDGKVWASDNWHTTTDYDTAPTFITDNIDGTTDTVVAVAEWQYDGSKYRLALTDDGTWHLKKDSAAWDTMGTNIGALVASTHGEYRVIADDENKDCWVLVSKKGLYYCADISVASPTFTRIWNESANDQSCEGRVTQDATTRTTLYVTWGKAFNGVWKLTRCDATTFVSVGSGGSASVAATGPGTATAMVGGSLSLTGFYGPIDIDPADGSMIVAEPGYTGLSKVHYAPNGTTFTDITDDVFPEVCQVPNAVRKRGNRAYLGSWTAGVIYGILS